MTTDLFARIPVHGFTVALNWYERLLGVLPAFFLTESEVA